ncbi:MAG TPA: hypothetical protein VE153_05225 [Myxococcus sp.]|nr:hypothetical protein [Myxococcus sp.]
MLTLSSGPEKVANGGRDMVMGEVPATGAFTCDFLIPNTYPIDAVAPVIERDRMYMARRPGMLHKHIPARFDAAFNILTGGRYLFEKEHQARDYAEWVSQEFILDGTPFLDRSYFIAPDCRAWRTIGAIQVGDLATQTPVLRTERYAVPDTDLRGFLGARFPQVANRAVQQGLTGAWLLYDDETDVVSLVYFADRTGVYVPGLPDYTSLNALESAQPLGQVFADQGWQKIFDRTQWSLSIWYPFVTGDQGQPSVWPNSPPLPEPRRGDGVCEPSRGENASSAPEDCPVGCGNGVHDSSAETSQNCPSDVPAQ